MDIGFMLTYIIVPLIVGIGIISGKKNKNHLRIGQMLCFKAIVYFYCAIVNLIHYINDTWVVRYVAGLTIALAIMEGLSGIADSIIELQHNYEDKGGKK